MGCPCPHCTSPAVASRRQLFRHALLGEPAPEGFHWYLDGADGLSPPRSLLVCVAALSLLAALPASLALWWFNLALPPVAWLLILVPLLALLFDVLTTYRRYKRWSSEWVCDNCHRVFIPNSLLLS